MHSARSQASNASDQTENLATMLATTATADLLSSNELVVPLDPIKIEPDVFVKIKIRRHGSNLFQREESNRSPPQRIYEFVYL